MSRFSRVLFLVAAIVMLAAAPAVSSSGFEESPRVKTFELVFLDWLVPDWVVERVVDAIAKIGPEGMPNGDATPDPEDYPTDGGPGPGAGPGTTSG